MSKIKVLDALLVVISVLVFVVIVTGCATPSKIESTGEDVQPPYGWTEYCIRNPYDRKCQEPK